PPRVALLSHTVPNFTEIGSTIERAADRAGSPCLRFARRTRLRRDRAARVQPLRDGLDAQTFSAQFEDLAHDGRLILVDGTVNPDTPADRITSDDILVTEASATSAKPAPRLADHGVADPLACLLALGFRGKVHGGQEELVG